MRRRSDRLKWIILTAAGAVVVVILIVAALVVTRLNERRRLEDEWRAAQAAAAAGAAPAAVDPYANRAADAIAAVQRRSAGGATVEARVEARALEERVHALSRSGVEVVGWQAQRVAEHSVYAVTYAYRFHAVEFGPRWYVQLDPEGPRPDGSGGVVPVNGLARQLEKADLDDGLRYLNRADEVLLALTEHQFEQGARLGSALLVFFEGRGEAGDRRVIGWHVVPEATDPSSDLLYRAYFQWEEGGAVQDAWWEVNLTNRDFRAKDLQANEIMAIGVSVGQSDMIDIRPRTLDLTQPPEAEPDPRRRALRYLLANDRLVEAVATLLTYRARGGNLAYDGWDPSVTDERHVYDVACRFTQAGVERRVTWRVDANTGEVVPTSEIAETARLVLEQVDAPAQPEP
ncbi:MAG: hypothetical protein H6697_00260 [Myxococcales bacterium]|nr:hypothetical protein [Myxococcales bacterium]MCB9520059.1 hypothetical protein [Myxococcales bacterium]